MGFDLYYLYTIRKEEVVQIENVTVKSATINTNPSSVSRIMRTMQAKAYTYFDKNEDTHVCYLAHVEYKDKYTDKHVEYKDQGPTPIYTLPTPIYTLYTRLEQLLDKISVNETKELIPVPVYNAIIQYRDILTTNAFVTAWKHWNEFVIKLNSNDKLVAKGGKKTHRAKSAKNNRRVKSVNKTTLIRA